MEEAQINIELMQQENIINILKCIKESSLDIKFYKGLEYLFKYKNFSFKIKGDGIYANETVINKALFRYSVFIKEKNMDSNSFDEYISYSAELFNKLLSDEFYKKIFYFLSNTFELSIKDGRSFDFSQKYRMNTKYEFKSSIIKELSYAAYFIVSNGKPDLSLFSSFGAKINENEFINLESKLKLTVDPFGDEIVIHNNPKDIKTLSERTY